MDLDRLRGLIESACAGLGADVKAAPIMAETLRNLYDDVPMDEVYKAELDALRARVGDDPAVWLPIFMGRAEA